MPRVNYCLPIDVVRRFNPAITQSTIDSDGYLTEDTRDAIASRIEGVESQFETDTGAALREVRVGSQGAPATYETLPAKRGGRMPVTYTLDHRNVHPIDSAQGDTVEVRTGKDSWDDITADAGTRFKLIDPRQGKLEFYSRYRQTVALRIRPGVDGFIRLTYRYGGLGGSPTEGGQTTLGAALSNGATPSNLSVSDASRLPNEGGVMLVNGLEYVRVTNVDTTNDEVDIAERGLRRTASTHDHSSGDILHYCPIRVRESIAAKAAEELVRYDAFVEDLLPSNADIDPTRKLDDWSAEYDRLTARYRTWSYA